MRHPQFQIRNSHLKNQTMRRKQLLRQKHLWLQQSTYRMWNSDVKTQTMRRKFLRLQQHPWPSSQYLLQIFLMNFKQFHFPATSHTRLKRHVSRKNAAYAWSPLKRDSPLLLYNVCILSTNIVSPHGRTKVKYAPQIWKKFSDKLNKNCKIKMNRSSFFDSSDNESSIMSQSQASQGLCPFCNTMVENLEYHQLECEGLAEIL